MGHARHLRAAAKLDVTYHSRMSAHHDEATELGGTGNAGLEAHGPGLRALDGPVKEPGQPCQ
jgi:hypothetical protein